MDAENRRCFWGARRDHGIVKENVVNPLGTLNNVDAKKIVPSEEETAKNSDKCFWGFEDISFGGKELQNLGNHAVGSLK